jgi:RNA methyltransferase, TrmH family
MAGRALIQSVSNSMVKHAFSLKASRKIRDQEDFLCEGFHLAEEAQKSRLHFRFIFGTKEAWQTPEGRRIDAVAHLEKTKTFEAPSKIISYMSDTVTPQGMVAVVRKIESAWPPENPRLLLGIYQIQDAGNLGTLLRSAEAFGAQGVFLTEGSCDPYNPKAVRSSMGSLFRVPLVHGLPWETFSRWANEKKIPMIGLAGGGEQSLLEVDREKPALLWIGSEGSGLPSELLKACSKRVRIPMKGQVESLNAGIAASAALFWYSTGGPSFDTPSGE